MTAAQAFFLLAEWNKVLDLGMQILYWAYSYMLINIAVWWNF